MVDILLAASIHHTILLLLWPREYLQNFMMSANTAADSSPPASFRWLKAAELGYAEDSNTKNSNEQLEEQQQQEGPVCFHCGKEATNEVTFPKCSKCGVASYCSRECQVSNWKSGGDKIGHKHACAAYKRVGEDMMIMFGDDKDVARQDVLSKIRFYAIPYAVYKSSKAGRGFLFLQSDSSLAVMSLPIPVMSNGRSCPQQRSVILHWLTMEEYDKEVCRDDFEMATMRNDLKSAVETYNDDVEVPVLMRFRCGNVAVGIAPLVPDYKLSQILGKEYYGHGQDSGALQLNIDDV